ncbi:CpaF family protein, partial [candidate division CSSED10-310 bacterium]
QETFRVIVELIDELGTAIESREERQKIAKEILDEALGLGPLEDLIRNDTITEIMVNKYNRIYIERDGKLELTKYSFINNRQLLGVIERIVSPLGRRIDESTPFVDARLADGSRVNAIIPPVSLQGPMITIRKFSQVPYTVDDLIKFDTLTPEMSEFFNAAVKSRQNILISGGTGSGKTTLLNVMSAYIPTNERILTIEDAAELKLTQDHVASLEARPPNIEGEGEVTIRDLVRNALRMRPDRIIVGECRGGETLDMLQAMNTGHDGSLTTIHANSPVDSLSRLETMVLFAGFEIPAVAIRQQTSSALNLIIQTARFSVDGSRKITHVFEVTGLKNAEITMEPVFLYIQTGITNKGKVQGKFLPTGYIPAFVREYMRRGQKMSLEIFKVGNNDDLKLIQEYLSHQRVIR